MVTFSDLGAFRVQHQLGRASLCTGLSCVHSEVDWSLHFGGTAQEGHRMGPSRPVEPETQVTCPSVSAE